jgi:hypothetical protein
MSFGWHRRVDGQGIRNRDVRFIVHNLVRVNHKCVGVFSFDELSCDEASFVTVYCVDGNECVNRAHQASNQQAQIQAFSLKTVEVTW